MTSAAARPRDDAPPRRKATLFCQSCDHESPVDGDWRLRSRDDRTEYVCPVCDATVTERPVPEDAPDPSEPPSARVAKAWGRLVLTPVKMLCVTVEAGGAGDAESGDCCV